MLRLELVRHDILRKVIEEHRWRQVVVIIFIHAQDVVLCAREQRDLCWMDDSDVANIGTSRLV